MVEKNKINQLTFTRFVAALLVVVYHFGYTIFPFNLEYLNTIIINGNVAVSYFFILSGFVMIVSYWPKMQSGGISYSSFYINRIARIYPVYFLALISFLLMDIYWSASIDLIAVMLNLSLMQSWIPNFSKSLNFPGWSLSVEMFFYILFPFLLGSLYSRLTIRNVFISIILLWLFSLIFFIIFISSNFYKANLPDSHSFAFNFPLLHLNEFLVGNLIGFIFLNNKVARNKLDFYLILITIVIITVMLFELNPAFHNGLFALLFAPFILLMAYNHKGKISHFFCNSFFVLLGEASYGIYILQVPVFRFCKHLFGKLNVTNVTLIFYLSLVVLIGVSIISYFVIERPFKSIIKNVGERI